MTSRSSGTVYYDEPWKLWLIRRAEAWGEFVNRFGLEGTWATQWPQQPNVTDNRTFAVDVGHAYLRSAVEALEQIVDPHFNGDHSDWPMDDQALAALLDHWTEETVERAIAIIERGFEPGSAIAGDLFHVGESLLDDSEAKNKLLGRLPARSSTQRSASLPPPAGAPSLRPVGRKSEGINIDRRYFVTVTGLAIRGTDWLVAASGQDLDTRDLDSGNYLFRGTAAGFSRIQPAQALQGSVAAMVQEGSVVWMVSLTDGVARVDLKNWAWQRWDLAGRLPVERFSDLDVDPDHTPFAVSGDTIWPPVLIGLQDGQWISRLVETFYRGDILKPFARRLAVTRRAMLIAGNHYGVSPFMVLWRRDGQEWINLRPALLAHLAEQKIDMSRVRQDPERFNALDAVALNGGGFVLLHNLGATWIDDAGLPQRSVAWGEPRWITGGDGKALLSRDGSRIWFAGSINRTSEHVLVELPLNVGDKPRVLDVLRDVDPVIRRPWPLAEDGNRLLISGPSSGPDVVFVPLTNE